MKNSILDNKISILDMLFYFMFCGIYEDKDDYYKHINPVRLYFQKKVWLWTVIRTYPFIPVLRVVVVQVKHLLSTHEYDAY